MPTLLVFGARNLGRVLARELSEQGWRVAAVARTESTIEQLRDEVPDAVGLIGDAGNPDDVERIFEHVGRVDVVVNAITTTPSFGGPIHEAPSEALEAYVGALLPGIFNVLRVGGRVLAQQRSGTLVQVTGGSTRRGNPGRGPWAAAASATRALVQSQAAELREDGVHVALHRGRDHREREDEGLARGRAGREVRLDGRRRARNRIPARAEPAGMDA